MVKNLPVNAEDTGHSGSISGSGRSPGERNSKPLRYSRLRNPWTEEPGGLQSMGCKESHMTEWPSREGYMLLF